MLSLTCSHEKKRKEKDHSACLSVCRRVKGRGRWQRGTGKREGRFPPFRKKRRKSRPLPFLTTKGGKVHTKNGKGGMEIHRTLFTSLSRKKRKRRKKENARILCFIIPGLERGPSRKKKRGIQGRDHVIAIPAYYLSIRGEREGPSLAPSLPLRKGR